MVSQTKTHHFSNLHRATQHKFQHALKAHWEREKISWWESKKENSKVKDQEKGERKENDDTWSSLPLQLERSLFVWGWCSVEEWREERKSREGEIWKNMYVSRANRGDACEWAHWV